MHFTLDLIRSISHLKKKEDSDVESGVPMTVEL
jgi:hypothetical protein